MAVVSLPAQLNEAELEVEADQATYKQKLEVLQQQEELIEDEKEQEQKEEDARRARREEEARLAETLLPESEVCLAVQLFATVQMTSLCHLVPTRGSRRKGRDRCPYDFRASEGTRRGLVHLERQV